MNEEPLNKPGTTASPAPAVEHHPAYLAVIAGLPVKAFKLATGSFIVGRAPEADFRLDHFEVSRRHCRVSWDSETGECFVEDLQSQWGTRVDNRPITGRTQLKPGDILTLGCVVLLFEIGQPPPEDELSKLGGTWTQAGTATPVLFRRQKVQRIELGDHVTFGRDPNSDVVLNAPAVSRHHALVRRVPQGFQVVDLQSTAGSFVNGHRFDEHDLTIGDRLQIGPFFFQFDGRALHCVSPISGGRIYAREITKTINGRAILNHITLDIAPSRFAGIIGPSGAGKSSLLEALSGMRAPNEGTVLVDGVDVFAEAQHRAFGYVPQEDIVHRELTVSEALRFAAKLRLPHGTPATEIQKLVLQTLDQLGLRDRAANRIGNLSGGQRKRVSVAVELLARPPVLFLDEPTSGLDPATEFKLMELLRELADRACTVVCTTHVMENVYLMDQLIVIVAGMEIFDGSPQEAREFFGIQRLSGLYDQLDEKTPAQWREEWREKHEETPILPPARVQRTAHDAAAMRHSVLAALGILLQRQLAILRSDWRNYAILLGQPVLLAALVSWVSNDTELLLFFAYIATLWFGCSNAAQEIVREIAIYRRERIVGVSRAAYVASKFLFLGAVTAAQSLLFYLCLQMFEGSLDGSPMWQCAALLSIAAASVGIGSAISALSRTVMQAVVVVPLALIPLILLSGHPVPANEMKPAVLAVSQFVPTFAAQRCMDLSFWWGRRIESETLRAHMIAYRNIIIRTGRLKTGEVFWRGAPGIEALITEWVWVAAGYVVALLALRAREKS